MKKSIGSGRGSVYNIILKALQTGDKYGYEICKEVENKSKGSYTNVYIPNTYNIDLSELSVSRANFFDEDDDDYDYDEDFEELEDVNSEETVFEQLDAADDIDPLDGEDDVDAENADDEQ